MKRNAVLALIGLFICGAVAGSSHSVADAPTRWRPENGVVIALRGEAAKYCWEQIHDGKPPSRLYIDAVGYVTQMFSNGRFHVQGLLPASDQNRLVTISLLVPAEDIGEGGKIKAAKSHGLRIRSWDLRDEYVSP